MRTFFLLVTTLALQTTASAQSPWGAVANLPWQPIRLTYEVCQQLQTPDSNTIWMLNTYSPGQGQTSYHARSTADNGQTWQSHTIANSSYLPATSSYTGSRIVDIWSTNAQTAWIVVQNYGTGQYHVEKTTTGPTGFSIVSSIPYNQGYQSIRFFDANVGVLLGKPTATSWVVQRTTDAGTVWQAVIGVPTARANEQLTRLEVRGNSIWACTSLGNVLRSADQGQTWALASTGLGVDLLGVSFRDSNNGLAYGRGSLLSRTTNGGQTWTAVTFTGPLRLREIAAIPGSTGSYISGGSLASYTLGDTFGSALTTDNGVTWQNIENNIPFDHIVANSATDVLAVSGLGTNASLYRYSGTALAVKSSKTAQLTFYPNPTTGLLQVAPTDGERQLQVFDMAGRLVRTVSVLPNTTQLDVSGLSPGLYQAKLADKKNNVTQSGKLLIKK